MTRVADHLSVADLEHRFRSCPDPVEARHVQVIWLLAQGHTVGATSKVTAFSTRWIELLLGRYNASGAAPRGPRGGGPPPVARGGGPQRPQAAPSDAGGAGGGAAAVGRAAA